MVVQCPHSHCLHANDCKNPRADTSLLNSLSSSEFKPQRILYVLSRSALKFCNLSMKSCSVGSLPYFSYHLRAKSTIGAISPLLISLQPRGPAAFGCFPQHG